MPLGNPIQSADFTAAQVTRSCSSTFKLFNEFGELIAPKTASKSQEIR